jgi:hypothetical protein
MDIVTADFGELNPYLSFLAYNLASAIVFTLFAEFCSIELILVTVGKYSNFLA